MTNTEPAECIQQSENCSGPIEYRPPLTDTGRSFPRCAAHFDTALQRQQEITHRYPVHAPADFDPTFAGESWDADE